MRRWMSRSSSSRWSYVVGERRVDQPERQVRMLEVKLLRTPSMRLLLYDLQRSTDNLRDAMILIRNNMFVASLHKNCRIPHWHENPLQHVPGASTRDDCNKP